MLITDATAADEQAIRDLALTNKMFAPDEMGDFGEALNGYLSGSTPEHHWVVARSDTGRDAEVAGAAYYAPEPFADRMWNLYFLATAPDRHGSGVGSALLEHVESALRDQGEQVARTLIIDTSSTEQYAAARSFYQHRGYHHEASIRDFYGPGDAKVTYWKSLH